MQIDFHHGVTYVCARLAGFAAAEAEIVAHAAQYVDDATEAGEIWFDNGMIYARIASAHKLLDYRNMRDLANHRVWLPFHFLPGNRGEPAPAEPPVYGSAEDFLSRCVCLPNSHPAREMMRVAIERQDRPYALHRLGIAAHVFVDTWAHQGFVGYEHRLNRASAVRAENDHHHRRSFDERAKHFFGLRGVRMLALVWPVGHGATLSYPDRPYLRWSYTNGLGQRIERNNPRDFLEAAGEAYQYFCRYRLWPEQGSAVFQTVYPFPESWRRIGPYLAAINDEDEHRRHRKWLDLIAEGVFGFQENIRYIEKGMGSWKHLALKTVEDIADSRRSPLPYPEPFLDSHWRLFHDALQAHRFYVLHELLPRYGLLSG
ncbi:MAG: hypothetical protein JNK31_00880 [Candidatus Competibacter sp.]|nr:hypothetical protein [Candidatus Competibacter sp.]